MEAVAPNDPVWASQAPQISPPMKNLCLDVANTREAVDGVHAPSSTDLCLQTQWLTFLLIHSETKVMTFGFNVWEIETAAALVVTQAESAGIYRREGKTCSRGGKECDRGVFR